MVVVFEICRQEGRIKFEVIRGAERDERMLRRLFEKYGKEICKDVPLGTPVNLDVYKLKKILEGGKRKGKQQLPQYSRR